MSEEIFFRGFVLSILEQFSSTPFAIIVSSLIFGLVHVPFFFGTASFLLEALLGEHKSASSHHLKI